MNHKTDMQAAFDAYYAENWPLCKRSIEKGTASEEIIDEREALLDTWKDAWSAALACRPDAQADERYDLLQAAVNCPHEIESNRVVLHYSDKQPGHNALAQLRERLARTAAPQAEAAQGVPEDVIDAVSKALRRAWQLGQTYWQQADSDSYKQQDKSDETQKKFEKLLDETRSMLAAPSPNRETCRRCGGTGLVDDGEITGSEGAEFENGPVKCVKDCPACATPSPDREQAAYSAPFNTDVPQCCGNPETCNDPCVDHEQTQVELPERVIDKLFQAAGVSTCGPDGEDILDNLHAFARNVVAETLARLPASAPTLGERGACTCGNGLGHARHCPAFDESLMRYEPFALPQPQEAEPKELTEEQREALKYAIYALKQMTSVQADDALEVIGALLKNGE